MSKRKYYPNKWKQVNAVPSENFESIDFDLFMDLSFTTKIGYLNRPLANYRLHNTNLSITKLDQHVKELIDWLLNNKKKYVFKKIKLYNFYILLFKLSIRMLINKLIGRVVQW